MSGEPKYNWGIEAALDNVGAKWKPPILHELKEGTLRFSQPQGRIKLHITERMLTTKQLRRLEDDGFVTRQVYP